MTARSYSAKNWKSVADSVIDKTSPPRYVKTWDSSVAHSQYPRSKQMTSVCREHSARDRETAHGGVRELEGILPISMGIGDWSQS